MFPFLLTLIDEESDVLFFTELFTQYEKQMWYKANTILNDSQLAEDAVQNAFIGTAKHIKTVRKLSDEQMRSYLLTAAKNAALDIAKKTRYEIVSDRLVNEDSADGNDDFSAAEENDFILHILDTISDKYRDVLFYRLVLDFSEKQIAQMLNININTVRQRISRGKKIFAELYSKELKKVESKHV